MAKLLKNRVIAVRPKAGHLVPDLHSKLVQKFNNAGLHYLHVGAGAEAAYAVLPDDHDLVRLETIAASCDAFVSGSGYLTLENFDSSEVENDLMERMLTLHPINYDIPVVDNNNLIIGLCGQCGGIGTHGPPCI